MPSYNGRTLAYIGDAVFELYVRERLLASGKVRPENLHNAAIEKTSAPAQERILEALTSHLSPSEKEIVKKGRNASIAKKPKNGDIMTYKRASGLEALFGHLYLEENTDRIDELMSLIFFG